MKKGSRDVLGGGGASMEQTLHFTEFVKQRARPERYFCDSQYSVRVNLKCAFAKLYQTVVCCNQAPPFCNCGICAQILCNYSCIRLSPNMHA